MVINMAICKMCHKPIPDGMDFCEECENKKQSQADESYLDSLLSSVSANLAGISSKSDTISKMLEPNEGISPGPNEVPIDTVTDKVPPDSVRDTVPSDSVLDEVPPDNIQAASDDITPTIAEDDIIPSSVEDDIIPSTAEDDIIPSDSGSDIIPSSEDAVISEASSEEDNNETSDFDGSLAPDEDMDELLSSLLEDIDEASASQEESSDGTNEPLSLESDDINAIFEEAENIANQGMDSDSPDIPDEAETAVEEEPDIVDIGFDATEAAFDETLAAPAPEDAQTADGLEPDNIDSLFEEISPSGDSEFLTEEDLEKSDSGSDGDLIDMDQLLNDIDSGEIDSKIQSLDSANSIEAPKEEKPKKQSLFTRLFANIREEHTPEELQEMKEKQEKEEQKKQELKELKAKQKQASKEEKEELKKKIKAEKEAAAKQKAEIKKQKQAEAKEKAQKKKEAKLAIEEYEIDEGRINRAGASILFVIFAIITVFIIVGSNIYSYNLSIERAQEEFDIRHYNDAYYEVYGLKIQVDDIPLYDKIMTVMYVNTQLNSYHYYMTSNEREKALDSLLKGLQKYDKYLELARELDITDDLNYVKSIILNELEAEFSLSEAEADQMVEIRDEVDYSEYIYTLLGSYEVLINE